MSAGSTAAVALRTTSFGSDSRNTFFHAEPTCLTIGLTQIKPTHNGRPQD